MSKHFAALMVIFVLAFGTMTLCDVTLAYADTPVAAAPANNSPCSHYAGLTNRIASCIRESIGHATTTYFDPNNGVYHILARAIGAVITIAIAIYGVMASMGMIEKVGRDTIMLLIKISLVGYFTTHVDLMYTTLIDAMDYTAAEVVKFTPSTGSAVNYSQQADPAAAPAAGGGGAIDFSQITCIKNMKNAQNSNANGGTPNAVTGPWMGMDCVLDTVIGLRDTSRPNGGLDNNWVNNQLSPSRNSLQRGMMMVFFSGIQTSVVGIILGLVGFIFLWGLVMLILKAMFVYIGGYLGITLLMLLAPLFIPMALFQVTKSYFDKWIRLLMGFTLQPIIVLVFISFSIAAIDLATFSGNYSIIYRMAGDASRVQGFNLNTYLLEKGAVTDKTKQFMHVKTPPPGDKELPPTAGDVKTEGLAAGWITSNCTAAKMNADPQLKKVCEDYHYVIGIAVKTIDWDKLAAARKPPVTPADGATTPGQQICNEVLAAAIFCGIVVFVMNGLFKVVPALAQDLMGDFGQSPDLFKLGSRPGGPGSTLPGFDKIPNLTKGLQDRMQSLVTPRS